MAWMAGLGEDFPGLVDLGGAPLDLLATLGRVLISRSLCRLFGDSPHTRMRAHGE